MITNEMILKLLCEMNINNSNLKTIETYKSLVKGVKDNIRTAANKAIGKNTLAKNAKVIIKNAIKKQNFITKLHGAWIDKNGKQYVCDSFRILEINEPIELPELPDTVKKSGYYEAYKVIEETRAKSVYKLKIPSIQELKAEIKIIKSQVSGKKTQYGGVALTLIDKGLTLNAQYLLELSEALCDIKTIYVSKHNTNINPIFMVNEVGLGFLLPISNTRELKGYWLS